MAPGRFAAAAVAATLVVAGAGCGAGAKPATTTAAKVQPGPTPPERTPFDLPADVPDHATGPARAASRRVIAGWLRALRGGHVERAAHYWALPSKFQNATPVLTIDTERERIAVNQALPCGAKATAMGGAGDYTIVSFVLTKRPGGDCGSGVGGTARSAIRVDGDRIAEWYRLPDEPQADSGPVV